MFPVTSYVRLDKNEKHALLKRIVGRCTRRGALGSPVVIFDLDGTLMDNRPRTAAIFRELGESVRTKMPAFASKLADANPSHLAYLVADSLKKIGVDHPEFILEAEQFWKQRFFFDEYLKHDVAVPGAVAFARECYAAGAVLVYLTGRDLPNMGLGSWKSLRDLGFPIGVAGTELVLKPDFETPDEAFKREYIPRLERVGQIIAAFDNEPANCNLVLEQNPEAESIFLDTQHLPGAPQLLPDVKIIEDFIVG